MSLSHQHNRSFLSGLSFKLALIYSVGLLVSSIAIFALIYYQVVFSFENQNRKHLLNRLNEVAQKIENIPATEFAVAEEYLALSPEDTNHYYFYSAQGDLLFSRTNNTQIEILPEQLQKLQEMADAKPQYKKVEESSSRPASLFVVKQLKGGEKLVVASSIDSESDGLSGLRRAFLWMLLPIAAVGFLFGYLVGGHLLKPIREIFFAFKKVERGSFSSRLSVGDGQGELNELKVVSNNVLDQVELAISNLREAFDHLAHDIRTPVTRLRGRAELALNGEESIDAYREALQSCYENSDRILRFLETLTQISEAENRALKLKIERVSLGEMVAEIMELYEIAFEEKNITVKKILLKADMVDCDQHLLKRVIANLLDNAHKYTPENGEIFIETYKTDKHVVLSVRDSGMGIPREELSLVWNRLFRGDKSRTAYGMGLGLTFVRAVVEAHGGSVSVLSPVADGRGTEFLIKLKQPVLKAMPGSSGPRG